jgi:hypothetical protein
MDHGRAFSVVCLLLAASAALAADAPAKRYFIRGYAEAGLMPPRNEMDLNLRRPDRPETDGFGDNFARYSLRAQLFLGRRFEGGFVKSAFAVLKPHFVFGRTVPQIDYSWSPRPIGYVKNFGVGVSLGDDWSVYLERHRWSFRDKIAITGDGPYGFHNAIVVRKEFRLEF